MRLTTKLMWLAMLFSLLAIPVLGQVESGSITGTVKDSTGAAVAGATVIAKNVSTSATRSAQTGDNGQYNIPGLTPGLYEVTVTATGFAAFTSRAEVTVGAATAIDAQLSVSNQTTTIEVVAAGGVEVNTQTQEISQIINPTQIEQLPSLTRNPYDFVAIAGNVSGGDRTNTANVQTSGGGQNNTDRGVGYSLNGQRSSGTELLLDGIENTNVFDTSIALLIPQDSVQEFRVITNNFDAQYGRASGGVINVTSKSGSNSFHGSGWEFNRLSAYTSNTFDNAVNGKPKGHYTRNQFGYDVGGPVIKDKLFFFQSTEWLRVRSNASLLGLVPTPEFLSAAAPDVQAYFSKYGGTLPFASTIPKAGTAFTPGGAFDKAIPAGTPVFGLVNYTAPTDAGGDLPQNTYNLMGRLDFNLTEKTQMFFRYGREDLIEFPGSAFASPYNQYNVGFSLLNDAYLYSLAHSFTSNIFSNSKLSFFRLTTANQYNTALQNTPTLFLYNNANIGGQPVNFPGFFDSTTGVGGLPFGGPQNTVQLVQDVSWIKGKHSMRYGGQFNYIQMNRAYGAYAQAVEQLGRTQALGLDNFITGTLTNYQVAINPGGKFSCARDFTTGLLIQTPQCTVALPVGSPSFARSDRYRDWALYAQDSWRVTPKLTFNYGVRYEYFGVQHNANQNLDSNFYYGPGSSFFERVRTGSVQPALSSPIHELWKPNYGTVGPRIGFAYDVFGNGSTAVRGGYGISYERNFGNVTFNIIQNLPNYATPQLHNIPVSVDNFGPVGTGTGTVPLPPVSPRDISQDIRTAQTQFWGLAIERQLGHRALFAVEYNGAHGLHLYDIKNINELGGGQAYLGDPLVSTVACGDPVAGIAAPCFSRPNAFYTSINNRGTAGFSHYNGLNLKFQTQDLWKTGFSIVTNYTWSHALDNSSSTFSESSSSSNGVGNLGYLDPRNPALDYGNADFDIRHRLVFSGVWTEPFFKGSRGFLSQVAGGWTVVPVYTVRAGTPFTVSDSTNSLNSGTGPYGIPRYTPTGTIPTFQTGSGVDQGGNVFNILSLPPANTTPFTTFTSQNCTPSATVICSVGVSDFGPFPANMTTRNAFRGPGAWNFDLAVAKSFPITERFRLEFRAEAYDLLNHHNMYVNGFNADFASAGTPTGLEIQGKKGGLGALANNGNHDERRFGQFALRLIF